MFDPFEKSKLRQHDLENQRDEVIRRVDRFLVGGCAGGTIAVLSVIGGILAKESESVIPQNLFYILILFLVGLSGSWVSLVVSGMHLRRQMDLLADNASPSLSAQVLGIIRFASVSTSSMALIVGVSWTLYFLHSRTG